MNSLASCSLEQISQNPKLDTVMNLRSLRDQLKNDSIKTGRQYFEYIGFDTGHFSGRYAGVRIDFQNIVTFEIHCVFFNAHLHRARTTSAGAANTPLKGKQFRITKRHAFYRFWAVNQFDIPDRLSKFHDHMGKLKRGFFSAIGLKNNRLNKRSLRFIRDIGDISSLELTQETQNFLSNLPTGTTANQFSYADLDDLPFVANSPVADGKQINDTPSTNNHTGIKRAPQDQSVDEWLQDYSTTRDVRTGLNYSLQAQDYHPTPPKP
jgi:hypothetical protein